jgi:hypothetical protein
MSRIVLRSIRPPVSIVIAGDVHGFVDWEPPRRGRPMRDDSFDRRIERRKVKRCFAPHAAAAAAWHHPPR